MRPSLLSAPSRNPSVCLTVPELPACFIPAVQLEGSLLSNCSSTDRGISLSNTGSSRDVGSVVSARTPACPLKKDCTLLLLLRSGFMVGDGMKQAACGPSGALLGIRSFKPDLQDAIQPPRVSVGSLLLKFSVKWHQNWGK